MAYVGVDKERYDAGNRFLSQDRFLANYSPYSMDTSTPNNMAGVVSSSAALPYLYGNNDNPYISIEDKISNFNTATANRQQNLENPNMLSNFLGNQRSVNEMMNPVNTKFSRSIADTRNFGLDVLPGAGQYGYMPGIVEGDVRRTSGIPFGISSLISKALPDKYYDMSPADQIFIQSNMGYDGNKDPFGINVRSAFGDYGAYTDKMADEEGDLAKLVADQKRRGLRNTIQMQKLNFYQNQARNRNIINANVATRNKMRDAYEAETRRELTAADRRFADTRDYDEYSGAGGSPTGPSVTYTSENPMAKGMDKTYSYEGSDEQDRDNENTSSRNESPAYDYAYGGIVGMYR